MATDHDPRDAAPEPAASDSTDVDWEALFAAARDVRLASHSPYSRFRVGAALLTEGGVVYRGTNVENRTFGLCLCAERSAVAAAVAAGETAYRAIAVVTDASPPAVPCGMCLETLTEFAPDLPILVANLDGERRRHTLRELHPNPFRFPAPRA